MRRELSDNFCFYEPNYDTLDCAAPWARESLDKHRSDAREYIYTRCACSRHLHPRSLRARWLQASGQRRAVHSPFALYNDVSLAAPLWP